jgi:5'-nucleotidase
VRIGIAGAAGTHTPASTKRRNLHGLTFGDPVPALAERTRALRAAGAELVVAVLHDGARCERDRPAACAGSGLDVARQVADRPDAERPDVFVMGHAHVNLDLRVDGMPVVEAASHGRAIALVEVPLTGAAGRRPAWSELRAVPGDSLAERDPAVDSIVRTAIERVRARLERPVTTLAESMPRRGSQYGLGNLVADAVRVAGNGDVGIWNNGGMRADLPAGALTYGGVHELVPFGNRLVRVRLRGHELAAAAERWVRGNGPDVHVSGLTVEYDAARPAGARVSRLVTADGRPLDPNRIYTLVINDFMADGGDGVAPDRYLSQELLPIRDIDAVSAHLRRQPQPVRAPSDVRIRAVGAGASR